MSTHSPTGASGMERWSNCPGSVAFIATLPTPPSSEHAERGTRAHEAAAEWLETGVPPVFDDQEDMLAVAEYVRVCNAFYSPEHQKLGAIRGVEYRFETHINGMYGTSDYWVYWPWAQKLIVLDYKHGEGMFVDVVENKQLLYYALGVFMTQGLVADDVRSIELGIVQPRCMAGTDKERVRMWEIDRARLLAFEGELRAAINATKEGHAPLVVGSHCAKSFCPARAVCPAQQQQREQALTEDFAGLVAKPEGKVWDVRDLAKALDRREALRSYLTALDEFAYQAMNNGVSVPGYKLVQKQGRRKYADPVLFENTLKAAGFGKEIYTVPELLSPAQLEKVIPSHKALIKEHTIVESSGLTVVEESDKRPAVLASAAADFSKVSLESLGL